MTDLIKIQNELKVPKGNLNKFGNYKYRSAEDILEAVKPFLLKYNCLLTLSDTIVELNNKLFLCAEAEFVCGERMKVIHGYAEIAEHKGMSAEQCTGTASSYARKYALNGLFLIDETEADADNENVKQTAPQKIESAKTTDELATIWKSLTKEEQTKFKDLITAKKNQLTQVNN